MWNTCLTSLLLWVSTLLSTVAWKLVDSLINRSISDAGYAVFPLVWWHIYGFEWLSTLPPNIVHCVLIGCGEFGAHWYYKQWSLNRVCVLPAGCTGGPSWLERPSAQCQRIKIRFISGNIWPIITSRKTVTGRQTKEHTTYNTLKRSPNVKYMLDKHVIMSVNTTIKSDLCVMYHSVKSW